MQRKVIVGRLEAVRDIARGWSRWLYRGALLAPLVWVAQQRLSAVWPFTIDDAGISYAYAKHIAEGHGPVAAVGGPWVEGYSNALWVFLLIPCHWLGFDLPRAAKLLGCVFFALAALLSGAALAQRRVNGWRSAGALEVGLALGLVSCVQVLVWVVAGLENSLFWALLAGLWYLDGRESRRPEAFGGSGLLAFALCITRPEAPLYVLPWLALRLFSALREPARRRSTLRALLLFLVPLALYHALHYLVFHAWVPNTFHAKASRTNWRDGYEYLLTNLSASGAYYVLPLALIGLWGRARLELLLVCNCLAGAAFILYSGGDWMPYGRFISLFAPALLLLAAAGVDQLLRALLALARQRLPREAFALPLSAGLIWFWWGQQAAPLKEVTRRPWCHFCERVAATQGVQRLSRQLGILRPSLLTQDLGGPTWLASDRLYPVDFLGLCDRNVALLRHAMVAGGRRISYDFSFYQYLFHEQPWGPSWISLPTNFWAVFGGSTEYFWDYFRFDSSRVPFARGPYFELHRGEFIDYFPSVLRVDGRSLAPQLALGGVGYFAPGEALGEASVAAGARVSVLVSLVPRGRLAGDEQVELRIDAPGLSTHSPPQPLLRGFPELARQISRGEPLRVEFGLELPQVQAQRYGVQIGFSRPSEPAQAPTWIELEPLQAGARLSKEQRTLPPFPAALPAARAPELRALRPAVVTSVEHRRRVADPGAPDALLVQRLLDLGQRLDRAGQTSDAYLAYVWATQVDPRAWQRASDPVFRLRQTSTDDQHPLELALLQDYYAKDTPAALTALVAFYLDGGRSDEARYFLRRAPAPTDEAVPLGLPLAQLAARLDLLEREPSTATGDVLSLVAHDPLGGALDFETPELSTWQGDLAAYRAGPLDELRNVRGQHGRGALSSGTRNDVARGSILSPEFVLQGRLLSVLIGGSGGRQTGVELLVDGQAVKSGRGTGGDFLSPELWDISQYAGKRARIRVFDRSKNAHVLVDRILLWN